MFILLNSLYLTQSQPMSLRMLKVIYENGARAGAATSFSSKHLICLGRHPDNDCVFESDEDRIVSSFHAEIRIEGSAVKISDCNSTNGIYVNGERTVEAQLLKSDLVELGKDGPCFRVELVSTGSPDIPRTDAIEEIHDIHAPPTRNRRGLTPTPSLDSALHPAQLATGEDHAQMARERTASPPQNSKRKKKFGERTAGLLIQRALIQAGLMAQPGSGKSTKDIEALVEKRLRLAGFRQQKLLLLIIGIVVCVGLALGIYFWQRFGKERNGAFVSALDVRGGESIAQNNRYAILMLAGRTPASTGAPVNADGDFQIEDGSSIKGFCTAFAVARDILATNAHCIQKSKDYTEIVAVMNGASQNRYAMIASAVHPEYVHGKLSPDVGLIRIDGELEHIVAIAPSDALARTVAGAPMYLYGFPDRLNREDSPEATFVKGDIGRVTTFDNRTGDFGQNTLLQHSAYTSEGTSGSPVFNAAGQVIGINAGGYADQGRILAGYNFAMRIDLINVLLPVLGGGQGS